MVYDDDGTSEWAENGLFGLLDSKQLENAENFSKLNTYLAME